MRFNAYYDLHAFSYRSTCFSNELVTLTKNAVSVCSHDSPNLLMMLTTNFGPQQTKNTTMIVKSILITCNIVVRNYSVYVCAAATSVFGLLFENNYILCRGCEDYAD